LPIPFKPSFKSPIPLFTPSLKSPNSVAKPLKSPPPPENKSLAAPTPRRSPLRLFLANFLAKLPPGIKLAPTSIAVSASPHKNSFTPIIF